MYVVAVGCRPKFSLLVSIFMTRLDTSDWNEFRQVGNDWRHSGNCFFLYILKLPLLRLIQNFISPLNVFWMVYDAPSFCFLHLIDVFVSSWSSSKQKKQPYDTGEFRNAHGNATMRPGLLSLKQTCRRGSWRTSSWPSTTSSWLSHRLITSTAPTQRNKHEHLSENLQSL